MNSLDLLAVRWPHSLMALQQTFFPGPAFGRTNEAGHNDAGYMLCGLDLMATAAQSTFAAHCLTLEQLDMIASREIRFQWNRKRQFRRTAPGLSTCLTNLVHERPERFYVNQRHGGKTSESAPTVRRESNPSDRRGYAPVSDCMPVLPRFERAAVETNANRRARIEGDARTPR